MCGYAAVPKDGRTCSYLSPFNDDNNHNISKSLEGSKTKV